MQRIVIHGGIKEFEGGNADPGMYQDALRVIVSDASIVLQNSGPREAVLCAVRALEDDELFNAGTGSRIQADGEIRMSAALMDGGNCLFSGVINVQDVKHPINLAALLEKEKHKVLAGDQATQFARQSGFESHDPFTEHRLNEFRKRQVANTGTVGAVAVDNNNRIFAATSTGGVGGETPGRVSDSATVAGTYANDQMGISLTGVGEEIVNHAAAVRIATRVDDGASLQEAVEKTVNEAKCRNYLYGLISLDKNGIVVVNQTQGTTLWASSDGADIKTF